MKHLLRELGAAAIMLFALSVCHAQTMVGLPQYGVTLSGTADSPVINNASGRDLLGYVLEANGGIYPELFTGHIRRGDPVETSINAGRTNEPNQPRHPETPHGPSTPTRLHAVIFADGEYVSSGPQAFDGFQFLAVSMEAEKGLGQMLVSARNNPSQLAAAWAKIYAFAEVPTMEETKSPEDGFRRGTQHIVARDLIATKRTRGDDAAFDMAERIAKLPSVWRKNQ